IVEAKVDAESAIHMDFSVMHGQGELSLDLEAAIDQFVFKTSLVCRFQKARPEFPVNGDRRTDCPFRNAVQDLLHTRLLFLCWSDSDISPQRARRTQRGKVATG